MQLPVLVEITRFTNYEPQSYYICDGVPSYSKDKTCELWRLAV